MTNKVTIKDVDPKKIYTSTEIQKFRLIPWARSSRTITDIIRQDFIGENILKANIEGSGTHSRYSVRGSNIIKFIEKYGSAVWIRPKQYGKTNRDS